MNNFFKIIFSLLAVAMLLGFGVTILAQTAPVISNAKPIGIVQPGSVTISVDTADLARCRYNTSDVNFNSMEGVLSSPDGLTHSANLGVLSNGSYTYYVRCKDFAGNENPTSLPITFTVGAAAPVQPTQPASTAPKIIKTGPSGILYQGYTTLSATTDKPADCRYSAYNKAYNSMTLYFESSDQLLHTDDITLPKYGTYTYYVRCADSSGNISSAAKISFTYKSLASTPSQPVKPADTTPPIIDPSSLGPSGTINTSTVNLTVSINEDGTCKYDVTDIEYANMANTFDVGAAPANINSDLSQTGTQSTIGTINGVYSFHKTITLGDPGPYTYYVRCQDKAGNANTTAAQIAFVYAKAVAPVISDVMPNSNANIYQAQVGLQLSTDIPSDCRYSTADIDYDAMQNSFNTNDNLLHQTTVNLDTPGPYIYYVRCKSKDGAKNDISTVINFQYQLENSNEENSQTGIGTTQNPTQTNTGTTENGSVCGDQPITLGVKDGECSNIQDYVCDPDCPPTPDSDADPDCACYYQQHPQKDNSLALVLGIIGFLLVAVIVVIIIILKRKSTADNEEIESLDEDDNQEEL